MPNPLWVDARDYLTNKGVPVTTGNLNSAMGFLAQNVDARPSYAKASPDAATSIGAGLGMPTDDLVRPVQDTDYLSLAQHVPNGASSNPEMRGSASSPIPQGITATPLPGSVGYSKPTSYTPPQAQARPQPRTQGTPNRTEKTASTRSQPKALPTNNRAETASARSDPIVSPVSTGSDPNIHGAPANVATPLPANVNPAIPDVSNGAYAPGGLDVDSIGPGALLGAGGLGAALLGMILSKGRGGRIPNAPRIPGVGASPLPAQMAKYGTPGVFNAPKAGPDPLAGAAPYGTPGVMADRPPNQSATPYSGAAPQTTPPQLEDLIAELTTAPPNRSIMGTTKGTKPPTPPPARPKAPASPTGTPTFAPAQQAEVEQMMADMAKKQPPAPPRQAPKTKTTVKIDKKKAAKK
jgi:hypothetical protein